MLVLSRNIGQMVQIGDDVSICILAIKGGQVRIGITAPKHTTIHREEVAEKIAADESLASIRD